MEIKLPYGGTSFDLDLPCDVRVEGASHPPALADPGGALSSAIMAPVQSKPLPGLLQGTGRISVLISDISRGRASGAILELLLERLVDLGVDRKRIEIFLATGMHRGHTPEELAGYLGPGTISRYRIVEHDAINGSFVEAGVTSAGTTCLFNERVADSSLVIGLGTVSFHYFAGFGGGRKLILPGISSESTIIANHRLSLLEDAGDGLVEGCRPANIAGNPVHEDMLEGARLLPAPVFMLNTVFDRDGRLVFINAGDLDRSYRAAVDWYRGKYSFGITRPYKAVLASAGGAPKDINLLQSHKAVRHAAEAVDHGGVLMIAAACPEGIGSDSYDDAFREGRDAVPGRVSSKYTLNSQRAMSTYDLTGRLSIYMRSSLAESELARFGFCPWREDYTRYLIDGLRADEILVIRDAAAFLPVLS
ncbi:MAG: nickel-dependent lactate racemase [Candidatus Krumholzibacteria bacterium]|nr:nickel-dependent lactate racemase [Candidatus Krumholzibacteria bacterium]